MNQSTCWYACEKYKIVMSFRLGLIMEESVIRENNGNEWGVTMKKRKTCRVGMSDKEKKRHEYIYFLLLL